MDGTRMDGGFRLLAAARSEQVCSLQVRRAGGRSRAASEQEKGRKAACRVASELDARNRATRCRAATSAVIANQ
jgi:hypothetical protein